ncbi:hypothetical protein N7475_008059 [Penicillium sp. IBT 31633x]|nr:hypothetical protein N7475_008059 [Penicillium sp. IBT 31633x]
MKYMRLASVATLFSAATVSAGPLRLRGNDDGYCPKGYTMSVYYKTVTVEPSPSATSVETTVTPSSPPVFTPTPTLVITEPLSSAEPVIAPSSAPVVVESKAPVAIVPVETSTSSTLVAEPSAAETVVETAPVVTPLPTSSAETSVIAQTTAASVVKPAVEQTSTTQATVEAPTSTKSSTSSSSTSSSSSNTGSTGGNAGEATFYGGNVGGGTCSFSGYTLPSHLFGTALSLERWDDAANCGNCVSVTGPNGNSVKAMIVDQCPECESNHIDLFQEAFAELSDISAGIIEVNWSYVSCDLDGPLKLKNKEGTSEYWFSMQVVNANEAVTSLEVSTDGGSSWQGTTRTYYNFFENSAGFGTSTVDVRITGSSGKTVVVKNVGVESSSEVTATSNL